MNNLTLSIMPTYKCDFNCDYCYLGDLTNDSKLLNLSLLSDRLKEIERKYNIQNVNLYGGELSLLKKTYLEELYSLVKKYRISLTSNLSNKNIIEFCLNHNIKLNISLNEERQFYSETLSIVKNLKQYRDFIDLSVVVLPSILNADIKDLYRFYSEIGLDVFFIQYHKSIHSRVSYNISINEFSNFLHNFIVEYKSHKDNNFNLENLTILRDNKYNPTSDAYLFITPDGLYSTVSFRNHVESYIMFNTLDEWEKFCRVQFENYLQKCIYCDLFKRCKAEHLEILYNERECSGLKQLIKSLTKENIVL